MAKRYTDEFRRDAVRIEIGPSWQRPKGAVTADRMTSKKPAHLENTVMILAARSGGKFEATP